MAESAQTDESHGQAGVRRRDTFVAVLLLTSLSLLFLGYHLSARPATLVVDGTTLHLRTHQRLTGGVLAQAGIVVGPADEVHPPLQSPWTAGQPIVVRRAHTVEIEADGQVRCLQTHPRSLLALLSQAGLSLHPGDLVLLNDRPVPQVALTDDTALLQMLSQSGAGLLSPSLRPAKWRVRLVRAVPLRIVDNGWPIEIRTTAATVGEALEAAGFRIRRADRVEPSLDTPVSAGLQVRIRRALPVRIAADGGTWETCTQASTVADLLAEEGVVLDASDRVLPSPQTPLSPGIEVRVLRVTTLEVGERVSIPYRHLQQPDPSMELDQYRLRPGEEGWKETVTRIRFEDGREVAREYLGERVVKEPVDQILFYGTRIVIRTLDTPYGPLEYWRKIRVLATSYYPSTCDKSPDDPTYGITYTGKRATRGIIAVDPRIIPLHTRLYVPGYGIGAAEDIGGKVKGKHIDLCFDDADRGKNLWSTRYVDVYLLTPVPPPHRIPWVIP